MHGPGVDEPLARIDGAGEVEFYHADGLGSIVRTTDSAGTIASTRRYDAWGNLEHGADQPGYAFIGREWDPETGLYDYRARYYDPKVGRFISEDPIGFAGGVNFYGYVGGNPVLWRDPLGLLDPPKGGLKGQLYPKGYGGSVTIAWDGTSWWPSGISVQGGVGLGGGIAFEPSHSVPGPKEKDRCFIGFSGSFGFNLGPINWEVLGGKYGFGASSEPGAPGFDDFYKVSTSGPGWKVKLSGFGISARGSSNVEVGAQTGTGE